MNTEFFKKWILPNLPYLFFVYLFDKAAQAFRLAPGADLSGKIFYLGKGFAAAFASAAPSFVLTDLLIGIAGAALIRLIVYVKGRNAKKYRKGIEYGSARWGKAADIKPYIDPVFDNNVILTQTERLMMSNRPKNPKYARNKNVLVIGGSGSGKTRFFVKPNLMQLHSSYVVTDPKGTLLVECGQLLQRAKYRIKVLNTINFSKSMKYNPFSYIRSEKDILKLVNTIIANTKGDGEKSGEDFWIKAERLYYTALIGYIWYEAPEEEKNFTILLDMINASEAREDDEDFQNPVDLMFERLAEKDPDHFAVKQYAKYKLAAGKADPDEFLSGISDMARELVKTYPFLSDDDEQRFQEERKVIGKCPRCGGQVFEGKKNYYCSNKDCAFVMWKNDRFFLDRKVAFSEKIAADLLKRGKAKVKKLYSPKTGKTYDGTVFLADTGEKYVNYKVAIERDMELS